MEGKNFFAYSDSLMSMTDEGIKSRIATILSNHTCSDFASALELLGPYPLLGLTPRLHFFYKVN